MGARAAGIEEVHADLTPNEKLEWIQLSRRARRIIWQNLFISLGTVAVLVGFALAQKIKSSLSVVGHEGSTVVVVLNSLRLLRIRPDRSI